MRQYPGLLCFLRRRLRATAWAALFVMLLGVGAQTASAAHGHAPDQHPDHPRCVICLALHGIDAALPGPTLTSNLPGQIDKLPVAALHSANLRPAAATPAARAPPHSTC